MIKMAQSKLHFILLMAVIQCCQVVLSDDCGQNEELGCAKTCEVCCSNLSMSCEEKSPCVKTCVCKQGFVRRRENEPCISVEWCPKINEFKEHCPENMMVVPCVIPCEINCNNLENTKCSINRCDPGCGCKPNYVRKDEKPDSLCVLPNVCNSTIGSIKVNTNYESFEKFGKLIETQDTPTTTEKNTDAPIVSTESVVETTTPNGPTTTIGENRPENETYDKNKGINVIINNSPVVVSKNDDYYLNHKFGYPNDGKYPPVEINDDNQSTTEENDHQKCGLNQTFTNCKNDCGKFEMCPGHAPPHFCKENYYSSAGSGRNYEKICNPGCICSPGFFRDNQLGQCVQKSECTQVCIGNEMFDTCGSHCKENCTAQVCDNSCAVGCFCRDNFFRNPETGECVSQVECPKDECKVKDPNSSSDSCVKCQSTCQDQGKEENCREKECAEGCRCIEGHVLDESSNLCTPINECAVETTAKPKKIEFSISGFVKMSRNHKNNKKDKKHSA